MVALLGLRAVLEEYTLKAELEGYEAYAARVCYRLVPGVCPKSAVDRERASWLAYAPNARMLPATPPRKFRRRLPGLSVANASPEAL